MLHPLDEVEVDLLLSEETEAWCTRQLQEIGFFEQEISDPARPFISSYMTLRDRIRKYQENQSLPVLALPPIPRGGARLYVRIQLGLVRGKD